jgi:hypothetical protein
VDELATRARLAGARVVEGPIDRPWHVREVTLLDRDGYRLSFPWKLDERTFADVFELTWREHEA